MPRAIDNRHAAAADTTEDLVVANALGRIILGKGAAAEDAVADRHNHRIRHPVQSARRGLAARTAIQVVGHIIQDGLGELAQGKGP